MLIDRGCAWYHRSPLVGKPIFFVTTTQASGTKKALKYLKDISLQWGTIYTGEISRTMFDSDKIIKFKELKNFHRYLDEKERQKYRPKLSQIIEFNTQKVLAKYVLPLDLAFWNEKGYMAQSYYYSCKIGLINKGLGALYFRMLSYFISKNKRD